MKLLQNLMETALELSLAPPDHTFLLLPLLPLLMVLLRKLHPEGVEVLPHLGQVTTHVYSFSYIFSQLKSLNRNLLF